MEEQEWRPRLGVMASRQIPTARIQVSSVTMRP